MLKPSMLAGFLCLLLAACTASAPQITDLRVAGPWVGGEREAFMTVIDGFTAKTKIPVSYESVPNEMGAALRTRAARGRVPDVALVPRPGEVAEFARAGALVDLGTFLSDQELAESYGRSFIDLGKVDGRQVGIFFKANSKSTFWFKPHSFNQHGLQVPRTLNDLFAISDKYKMSGKIPFAVGGKDGWVLTDYQENLFARLVDTKTYYDLYVSHKVAWTAPEVKQSLALLTRFFQPGDQPGGIPSVLRTGFVDSVAQVFGPNPKAELIYEGGFVGVIALTDVNRNLQPGQDIDFFLFPQVDPRYGDAVVGGGDTAVVFNDTPESRAFIRYLISKEAADILARANTISPNRLLDPGKFSSSLARKEYEQLVNGSKFVFDGSDLAPSALGGDFLFTQLQRLIQNPSEVDKIAQELEDFAKSAYKE